MRLHCTNLLNKKPLLRENVYEEVEEENEILEQFESVEKDLFDSGSEIAF